MFPGLEIGSWPIGLAEFDGSIVGADAGQIASSVDDILKSLKSTGIPGLSSLPTGDDLLKLATDQAQKLVPSLITGIHIRSNFAPDIDLINPFDPATAAANAAADPNSILVKSQPLIVLDTPAGPINIAPYGLPQPTQWSNEVEGVKSLGAGAAIALTASIPLAAYGLYKLLTK